MTSTERYEIVSHADYPAYIDALYHACSHWIPEIRIQFANKAVEMFRDETVRKLVLEYGKERADREVDMKNNFCWAASDGAVGECRDADILEPFILNKTDAYSKAIYFLFDIQSPS